MLLMAPRRNSNSASSNIIVQQQQHQQQHQFQQQLQQHPPLSQATQLHLQQQQHSLLYSTALFGGNSFESATSSSDDPSNINLHLNNNHHNISLNNIDDVQNGISSMSPMQTGSSAGTGTNATTNGHLHMTNSNGNSNNVQEQFTRCCYPNGECLNSNTLIGVEDLLDCVRVLCNNENCNMGQYMHRACFEAWEQSVSLTLKASGRARSWSDRQRAQNLWTKKGYDLVYKSCGCKCGQGHLRKDLDWSPMSANKVATLSVLYTNGTNGNGGGVVGGTGVQRIVNGTSSASSCNDDDDKKKKKKRNRNGQKPTLALTLLTANGCHNNNQQHAQQQQQEQRNNLSNATTNNNNKNSTFTNGDTNNAIMNNNNKPNNNIVNNSSPNPNVGVIGSGLHHSNNQQLQQQQQQQSQAPQLQQQLQPNVVASLNNILSLEFGARAGSLSSSGDSGSTSPSASHSSADFPISPIHQQPQQQQHTQTLLPQQPQQQQQQQQQNQQHQLQLQQYQNGVLQQQNGLSKSILNGALNGCVDALQRNAALLAAAKQQQAPVPMLFGGTTNGIKPLAIYDQHLVQQQRNKEVELYSERVRLTSGCNGIFSRRLDFSAFNFLKKTRLNSYQVKIEDEGNHGNDETRLFILSSLAQSQKSRVACILCEEPMLVFDRYPLVDGSFFLSPKQHSPGCIEVKYEGRALYLTCVCMACLDGTSTNRVISCRFCGEIWDGSNLVLGTMYSYDIFAAMPCCAERLKCNNCFKFLLNPQQRLNFYSDYSHCVTCPYCATQDTHFVKPLSHCYTKSNVGRLQPIA